MILQVKFLTFSAVSIVALMVSCQKKLDDKVDENTSTTEIVDFASKQFKTTIGELNDIHINHLPGEINPVILPRSLREDTIFYVRSRDWTSGFFGGNLWYMYELTGENYWKEQAVRYTAPIEKEKFNRGTHDLGFIIFCSFGNGYRLSQNEDYKAVIIEASNSVITRFNPNVGCIRSWDHNRDKWMFPVIVDNMMNLEMLFWASKITGDSVYYNIATSHADYTLKHHFRKDYSSYHVVDYDTISGTVRNKHTHQGHAHESAWSRGQAWGLYGYTMCYRETGRKEYLEQAEGIASFILNHPNLPDDLVPYWDFNAPDIPKAPRDVSAATIICSALFELSTFKTEKAHVYKAAALKILKNVSEKHRSETGSNKGFLLDHSTGHLPGNHELNVPIVYADYYFLESIIRYNTWFE